MTNQELNKDIKRLNSYINGIAQAAEMIGNNTIYFRDIEQYAKPEFIRLHRAADNFEVLTKDSILILLKLNRQHRFIDFHKFGILINIL